eukprot:jgi/Undpi1/12734/HiC_scaffold_6.g02402.m1
MAMDSRDAQEEAERMQKGHIAVMALDARLARELRQPLMSETLPILARHNREKEMRAKCPRAPLTDGSKVCVEAWGTVYRTTADGEAFILLDSDSHLGLILAPKDTELRPMSHQSLTENSLREMRSKAQTIMEAARVIGKNSKAGTQAGSSCEISANQEPVRRLPRVVSGSNLSVRHGVIHAREGELGSGEKGSAAVAKGRKPSKLARRSKN